jgi:hypothetical protein
VKLPPKNPTPLPSVGKAPVAGSGTDVPRVWHIVGIRSLVLCIDTYRTARRSPLSTNCRVLGPPMQIRNRLRWRILVAPGSDWKNIGLSRNWRSGPNWQGTVGRSVPINRLRDLAASCPVKSPLDHEARTNSPVSHAALAVTSRASTYHRQDSTRADIVERSCVHRLTRRDAGARTASTQELLVPPSPLFPSEPSAPKQNPTPTLPPPRTFSLLPLSPER